MASGAYWPRQGLSVDLDPSRLNCRGPPPRPAGLLKLQARSFGKGALGSPICLAPPNDGLALAICEGVEDALSIHAALGIGAWAAGSAPFMPALSANVPRFVEVVHVFGHRDGGERFARDLSGRLDVLGFEVILKFVEGRP
jgi:Toprim domain